MLDYQQVPPAFFRVRAIHIFYIRECPSCAGGKDYYHAGNSCPEELLFQAGDDNAKVSRQGLDAQPVDTKHGCGPAACCKVMDKSDYDRKCLFHTNRSAYRQAALYKETKRPEKIPDLFV